MVSKDPAIWGAYDRWNKAMCERYFNSELAHSPAYLDVDDTMLAEIGAKAGFIVHPGPNGTFVQQFLQHTRLTLNSPGSNFLDKHLRETARWLNGRETGQSSDEPPFVAMLGLLSYVAYGMRGESGISANNYHGRLFQALYPNLDPIMAGAGVQTAFRRWIPTFYALLAEWLEDYHQGARGLPSAVPGQSLNRLYVGYPISQAILSIEDRGKLKAFFAQTRRLKPGDDLNLEQLLQLLQEWVPSSSLTRTAKATFRKSEDDRLAFAKIALAEFNAWIGGPGPSHNGNVAQDLKVIASSRVFRGLPFFEFNIGFFSNSTESEQILRISKQSQPIWIKDDHSELDRLSFVLLGADAWGNREDINFSDFLNTEVQFKNYDASHTYKWDRHQIVVFEFNDDLGKYVSTNRPVSSRKLGILAHEHKAGSIKEQILDEMSNHIEHSYTTVPGIPHSWIFFDDVTLKPGALGAVKERIQLKVVGGLKIPGYGRKWLAARPPALEFLPDGPTSEFIIHVQDNQISEDNPPVNVPVSDKGDSRVTADLVEENLKTGSYRAVLLQGSGSRRHEIDSKRFGLHSADNPFMAFRGLAVDENLKEIPSYPNGMDVPYNGESLEILEDPPEKELPPRKLTSPQSAGVGFDPEGEEPHHEPEPQGERVIPEIHHELKVGDFVKHRVFGIGQVITVGDDKIDIYLKFDEPTGVKQVQWDIEKIVTPPVHNELMVGDSIEHVEFGQGLITEISDDLSIITILFAGAHVEKSVTQGIEGLATPPLHSKLIPGMRVLHREFGEGVVEYLSEDKFTVTIYFENDKSRREIRQGILRIVPNQMHEDLMPGDAVRHPEYGKGVVDSISEDHVSVVVRFESPSGQRVILFGLAPEIHYSAELKPGAQVRCLRLGEGTVIKVSEDRSSVTIDFGGDTGTKIVTHGIVEIIPPGIDISDLKDEMIVQHRTLGPAKVIEVDQVKNRALILPEGKKRTQWINEGVTEILENPGRLRLGEAVEHPTYGPGRLIGWAGDIHIIEFETGRTLRVEYGIMKREWKRL